MASACQLLGTRALTQPARLRSLDIPQTSNIRSRCRGRVTTSPLCQVSRGSQPLVPWASILKVCHLPSGDAPEMQTYALAYKARQQQFAALFHC